jgi:phosphoribosylamine---glycine ligase
LIREGKQMNILVVGGGGREHAIIGKLKENPGVGVIYALPGNGGIARDAVCVPIGASDIDAIAAYAKDHDIGFAIIGPDDPLALGAADRLRALGIPCFGPGAKAAQIESSKVFAKNLMKKYGIPTAAYQVFSDEAGAMGYLDSAEYPLVVKADGLALGKGVIICASRGEAEAAVHLIMGEKAFGESGNTIVIEEYLRGPEVSVLAFTDGKAIVPMVSAMDHKRAGEGDTGPNTGGMGVIAPNPHYTFDMARRCMQEIFLPTLDAMRKEGRPFKGCLYFGLMLTQAGPRVIEYNCRFGDPEAQAVLPLLKTDLLTVMEAVENETLSDLEVTFSGEHACCVMIASGGYPGAYPKGKKISLGNAAGIQGVTLYHSGTAAGPDGYLTAGGRVLGVTATGGTLAQAITRAYRAAGEIAFEGAYRRGDIGKKALEARTAGE